MVFGFFFVLLKNVWNISSKKLCSSFLRRHYPYPYRRYWWQRMEIYFVICFLIYLQTHTQTIHTTQCKLFSRLLTLLSFASFQLFLVWRAAIFIFKFSYIQNTYLIPNRYIKKSRKNGKPHRSNSTTRNISVECLEVFFCRCYYYRRASNEKKMFLHCSISLFTHRA